MKTTFVVVFFTLVATISISAKEVDDEQVEKLFENEQYEAIIELSNQNYKNYSGKVLFYIGSAYSMMDDNANCIKYMDLAIAKDSLRPSVFQVKADCLLYTRQLEAAISCYQKAVSLSVDKDEIAEAYRGMGYAYYNLENYEQTIEICNKAIDNDKLNITPYMLIAQSYSELGNEEKALETYYIAKENVSKEDEMYTMILFNIGLLEQQKGNHNIAEKLYYEVININPADYHAYAKLIQVCYYNKDYEKAKSLKSILYKAYEADLLKDSNLEDMFCVDQFEFEKYKVQAYERYESGEKPNIYDKLVFSIFDENGEFSHTIQTEYSPAAKALGYPKYVLCAWKNSVHFNYGLAFDDDSNYDNIKEAVIEVLKEELTAVGASTFNNINAK